MEEIEGKKIEEIEIMKKYIEEIEKRERIIERMSEIIWKKMWNEGKILVKKDEEGKDSLIGPKEIREYVEKEIEKEKNNG